MKEYVKVKIILFNDGLLTLYSGFAVPCVDGYNRTFSLCLCWAHSTVHDDNMLSFVGSYLGVAKVIDAFKSARVKNFC